MTETETEPEILYRARLRKADVEDSLHALDIAIHAFRIDLLSPLQGAITASVEDDGEHWLISFRRV